jgi:hypothetical protein
MNLYNEMSELEKKFWLHFLSEDMIKAAVGANTLIVYATAEAFKKKIPESNYTECLRHMSNRLHPRENIDEFLKSYRIDEG